MDMLMLKITYLLTYSGQQHKQSYAGLLKATNY